MKFSDVSIKWQLISLILLLMFIPLLIFGISAYKSAEIDLISNVEKELSRESLQLKENIEASILHINHMNNEALINLKLQEKSISVIVSTILKTILSNKDDKVNTELFDSLSKLNIGKSGYVSILDLNGNYIIDRNIFINQEYFNLTSKKRSEPSFDSNFTTKILEIVKTLESEEIQYINYSLSNNSTINIKTMLIGVSYSNSSKLIILTNAYYEDFTSDFSDNLKKELKNEMSKHVIGKTGYHWVLDSKGNYIISKDNLRNGENIFESQDSNGNYFIKDMIINSKKMPAGKAYLHYYPWQNTDEKKPRTKLAAVVYIPEFDWVIGSSAYTEELLVNLQKIRLRSFYLSFIALFISSIIMYFVVNDFSNKIKLIVKKMDNIAKGENDVKLKSTSGKNELAQFIRSFQKMADEVNKSKSNLENNIEIKTKELSARIKELEKVRDVMTDSEIYAEQMRIERDSALEKLKNAKK